MDQPSYEIVYTGNLRTRMTHLKSGSEISTDAPTDNNGKGELFSPTDLLAASLSACMLTIVGIHLNKQGKALKEVKTQVKKIMRSNPRRVEEIQIDFDWGDNSFSEAEMDEIREVAMNCPVVKSLSDEILIRTNLTV